jgi:hypothetical protein
MPVRPAVIGLLGLSLLLGACAGGGEVPTASATAQPTSPGPGTADPTMSVPSMPPDKEGPNDLAGFDCTDNLRFQRAGSDVAAAVNLADVRIGAHEGFDRIVFETNRASAYDIQRALPPFFQDGSGRELNVAGDSFFRITLTGTTKQLGDGTSSYTGPTSFTPAGMSSVTSLVEGGDFESVSTWYVGVHGLGACMRVTTLDGPSRLVIDIGQLAAS